MSKPWPVETDEQLIKRPYEGKVIEVLCCSDGTIRILAVAVDTKDIFSFQPQPLILTGSGEHQLRLLWNNGGCTVLVNNIPLKGNVLHVETLTIDAQAHQPLSSELSIHRPDARNACQQWIDNPRAMFPAKRK